MGVSRTLSKVFVAYAASPAGIGDSIERARVLANLAVKPIELTTWKREDLAGSQLIQPIIDAIRGSDIVVADVTVLNFNVIYELGYAVGLGKRALPVRNRAFTADNALIDRVGIFDTLLREEYGDAEQLFEIISKAQPGQRIATSFPFDPLPLYIVLPEIKGDDFGNLSSRARRAGVKARTFDPTEQPRLGAVEAVRSVASSYGVVVPLLAPEMKDAQVHNMRAAFVAGVAHALEKPTLLLRHGDWPTPLDIRDEISTFSSEKQLGELFSAFAERVHDARYAVPQQPQNAQNVLAALNLGDPAAENEESQLEAYFLDRAEYRQIVDGRANIVVGRKGSGKTAVFMHSRDQIKANRSMVVVDLSPKSHELRKLKDVVLTCLAAGSKEFLLSAFWEYVLLLEVCSKILDKDIDVHKRNHKLFEPYQRLLKYYKEDGVSEALDFSERLSMLIDRVTDRYIALHGTNQGVVLSQGNLTKLLYETTLPELRREIELYAQNKDGIHVLFDNVDKGWNASGLEEADVIMVRTLIDAGRKLQNDFQRAGTKFRCVVFLRNDIYDLLISATPDRGKETSILVDWTDPDLLKQMVRRRLLFNTQEKGAAIDALWYKICVAIVSEENSLDYMIRRAMMRPRYLLKLINYCLGNAINYGRDRIDEDDIEKGLSAYSTYIITEIDLEIRDVLSGQDDVLYLFLGEKREMTKQEIMDLLAVRIKSPERLAAVFTMMLWHGVIGLMRSAHETTYIFDVNYDLKRLNGLMDKMRDGNPRMQINPGLWPGLELT